MTSLCNNWILLFEFILQLFMANIHIVWKSFMQAEHFLYFNNSRIYGEDLVPVKCI